MQLRRDLGASQTRSGLVRKTSGELEPGQPAPSRNYLAESDGVARETAARAHHWLAERGYLVAVAGVGMVITPPDRWPAEQAGHGEA